METVEKVCCIGELTELYECNFTPYVSAQSNPPRI